MRNGHQLSPEVITAVSLEVSPIRQAFDDFLLSRKAMLVKKATFGFYNFALEKFIAWLKLRNVQEPEGVCGSGRVSYYRIVENRKAAALVV